jgi:chorismate synthase
MAGNSFGQAFRLTTFGESHGGAVGVIVDGVTPGVELSLEDVQKQLDRRKTGQSYITTPRKEPDEVHFMSGIFEGKTTGTPLMMILYNKDAQPSAYNDIKNLYRPGHADFSYQQKYGFRDWRGSGRASGRETAGRVAAGAVARKILESRGISILAYTRRAAGIEIENYDPDVIEKNPLRAPDMVAAEKMNEIISRIKDEEDSMGALWSAVSAASARGSESRCSINSMPSWPTPCSRWVR